MSIPIAPHLRRFLFLALLLSMAAAPASQPGQPAGAASKYRRILDVSDPWKVVMIIGGTLISEDLTCVAVGNFIREDEIDPWLGGLSCFLGIWVGDVFFWALGRLLGRRILQNRWVRHKLPTQRLEQFGAWFDRRAWAAVAACRILPTIRVPLYVSIGALSKRTKTFFFWTAVFGCLWTPALILLVVFFGEAVTAPFHKLFGRGWVSLVVSSLAIFVAMRLIILLSTAEGRAKFKGWLTPWRPRAPAPPADPPVLAPPPRAEGNASA